MSNSNLYITKFTVNEEHQAISNLTTNEPVEDTVSINGVEYSKGGTLDEINMYGWGYNPTASGNVSYIAFSTKEGLPEVGDKLLAFGENGGYFPRATTTTVTEVLTDEEQFIAGTRTYQRLTRYDFTIKLV